jgi:hypothetical protein
MLGELPDVQNAKGKKQSAPPPPNWQANKPDMPDFVSAAREQATIQGQSTDKQTGQNRIGQSNVFGNVSYDPSTGAQNVSLNQDQQRLFDTSRQGATGSAQALNQPFSFGNLPGLTDGAAARDQAISSAYGQAASRLDPQWNQREDAERTRLANQGIDVGSDAYKNQMFSFGQARNDAYGSAMNSAIGQGTAAGNALFNQSLQGRQQMGNEALQQRSAIGNDYQRLLAGMQASGSPQFQGYNAAGAIQAPNLLGAAQGAGNYNMTAMQNEANYNLAAAQMNNQNESDFWGGLTGGLRGLIHPF